MKKNFTVAVATLSVIAACSDAPTASRSTMDVPDGPSLSVAVGPQFVPGEVIVKFRAGASATGRSRALERANGQAAEHILTAMMRRGGDAEGLTVVHTSLAVPQAIAALRGSPDVEYAEPNYIYQHGATSTDTYYTNGSLWGMYGDATSPANPFGSQAGEAWAADHTDCSSVYVGIIDEGYMYMHEDLVDNAATNPGEIPNNRIDDDGNGYVDDVYGWDFDGNNNSVFDGTADDHGTHVAGTIGGKGANGIGVAGVCWSVKLMDAKFLGRWGGTTANAVKAVDYFTDLKTNHGLNFVATSNSWGGGGFSQALQDAIERANAAGILFIAAAGNSTVDCDTASSCYPAEYSNANIIAVASITSTGAISSFSNWGASTIDIGAPGSGIYSTVPKKVRGKIVSGYASYSGTSMATPHVSGAAALYAAWNSGSLTGTPKENAATIKAAILSKAEPTLSLSGKVVSGGRLNVSGF
jgi:thermitase